MQVCFTATQIPRAGLPSLMGFSTVMNDSVKSSKLQISIISPWFTLELHSWKFYYVQLCQKIHYAYIKNGVRFWVHIRNEYPVRHLGCCAGWRTILHGEGLSSVITGLPAAPALLCKPQECLQNHTNNQRCPHKLQNDQTGNSVQSLSHVQLFVTPWSGAC